MQTYKESLCCQEILCCQESLCCQENNEILEEFLKVYFLLATTLYFTS